MRCPVCGGDFPQLTGHVHDPMGIAWWGNEEAAQQQKEFEAKEMVNASSPLSRVTKRHQVPMYKSVDGS